ncbi:hypothetical protein BC830DRAFT_906056 [Chytriomyces sp. MP71]|nr:hypothetical protein BC830DRAFT_906056 [Chytriomyces sp. MP71]
MLRSLRRHRFSLPSFSGHPSASYCSLLFVSIERLLSSHDCFSCGWLAVLHFFFIGKKLNLTCLDCAPVFTTSEQAKMIFSGASEAVPAWGLPLSASEVLYVDETEGDEDSGSTVGPVTEVPRAEQGFAGVMERTAETEAETELVSGGRGVVIVWDRRPSIPSALPFLQRPPFSRQEDRN